MVAVQKITAPVIYHQNAAIRIVFSHEQILNGEHRNFLETFQFIFELDHGTNHLILIHKREGENQIFFFPEIAFSPYQSLLQHYQIERCNSFPSRPFYPVFGTNADFDYWRQLLDWDQSR